MYCEGLVDYDAVRAASVTMYAEAMASMKAEEVLTLQPEGRVGRPRRNAGWLSIHRNLDQSQ